ncbi:hypothetical protein GG851_18815 [Bordetella petrii]|nr:hypothetical protein [Bordetella petrii]
MSAARMTWRPLRWLFSRRAAKAVLWTVLLLVVAVAANIAGIHYLGSVIGWERWLSEASGYFLLWRLCLYGATGYGWIWMRRRLLAREDQDDANRQARRRLMRSEIAGIVAIVTLEASLLMQD